MAELSDFPPEEQELIKEMLSLDYVMDRKYGKYWNGVAWV